MKQVTSLMLSIIMILSIFTIIPFSATAEENDYVVSDSASGEIKSGTTGDCTWTLDDNGVLTISGKGRTDDYGFSFGPTPWGINISQVIIENGVTGIGKYAFASCKKLTSVTIPDSVTSIDWNAFMECTGLTNVILGNSLESIEDYAFEGCTGLTSITIPDSVTSIGTEAFDGCTSLTSIDIPDSVTSIGFSAFSDTAWYDNQPDGVVYAGKVAYEYKGEMPDNTEITLKDGTFGIAAYAFSYRSELTDITIPDSVMNIGYGAFESCAGLTSVTIGNSVTSIGYCAFYDCTGLKSVTIPASVEEISENAFGYIVPYDYGEDRVEDFTIYGYKGTAAEIYANDNDFTFIELSEEEVLLGDADGDGKVSAIDVTCISQYLAKMDVKTFNETAADADGDGKLSVADSSCIQQYLAKFDIDHKIGEPI